jgi:hypothetical protein
MKWSKHGVVIVVLGLVIAACGGAATGASPTTVPATTSTDANADTNTKRAPAASKSGSELLPEQEIPDLLRHLTTVWETDFSRATVDLDEILVGIPALDPRDLIRPIDDPVFQPVAETAWLTDQDPGLALEIDGDARFYPLAVLTRHEIANDEVGGIPVAVTYCPLCNTGIVFDRRFEGQVLRLGVSGLLRNSDLVMWDDDTTSLWQQITGQGIVGTYAGEQLQTIGSAIVRWADFAVAYPDGQAMSGDQGFGIRYGTNPYTGYSSRPTPYPFFRGELDDRYPALERVVGVTLDEASKAYPFSEIEKVQVVNDIVADQPVVVFWGASDTADALDSSQISEAQGIGTGIAYSPVVGGQTLTFEVIGDIEFRDIETGTTWSILGKALEGELAGEALELLPHRNEFWFAWHAFFPDADVWQG